MNVRGAKAMKNLENSCTCVKTSVRKAEKIAAYLDE